MNGNQIGRARQCVARMALAGMLVWLGDATAAEYWLQTGTTTKLGVPMWGYALCGSGSTAPATCAGPVTVPGPALNVPPAEGLVVHLTNTLPEPTSLVIASQVKQEGMQPVWFEPATPATTYSGTRPSGNTTARVRSFDREASAGGGTATYTWTNLRPGTYLYSSGTHPQVQVQMGLYGAVTKDAGPGKVAYSGSGANITYDNQVTLLYSEIDPALHMAVAGGTYGAGGAGSTLAYQPSYFLINGEPFPSDKLDPLAIPTLGPDSTAVPAGSKLLIRFLNAGLKSHVPTIVGQYWQVVAEDGNPVPYLGNPRQQYTAFLPPAKTLDVLLRPTTNSTDATVRYAVFDSRLYDTTNGNPNGGMQFRLAVAPAPLAPPVFDSVPIVTGTIGIPYSYAAHANATAGHPVQYSLSGAPAGMTLNAATGLVGWTAPQAGTYALSVRATDQTIPALFADQSYTLMVSAAPAATVTAVADSYTAIAHAATLGSQTLPAPGVLANDKDSAARPLSAVKVGECTVSAGTCSPSTRVSLASNGALTLGSSTSTATIRLTYRAQAGTGASTQQSADTLATINLIANRGPTVAADAFTVPQCTTRSGNFGSVCRTGAGYYTPAVLALAANDADPDTATLDAANQLPLSVARLRATSTSNASTTSITTPAGGTVTVSGGAVTYVPRWNYRGADSFQYRVKDRLGKESGSTTTDTGNLTAGWATVTVTVQ
jgi:FtsP/CotA-like multicopper oxidase with cupredoxin domain